MVIERIEDVQDETFHTVTVTYRPDGGEYDITAQNNETVAETTVTSVALEGESVGIKGDVRFDAAGSRMELDYVRFREHGYDEVQINFRAKD